MRRSPHRYARRYFDHDWYLATYPDAASSDLEPYEHYCLIGVRQRLSPNPVFHVAGYLYDNPDVDEYGGNPLLHYVIAGRHRGSTPHPLFDANWYRRAHGDVGRMDPYLHYLVRGRGEKRATSGAVDPGGDIATLAIDLDTRQPERVTVIVPAYRQFALTYRCLYALGKRTLGRLNFRVILADDDPTRPVAPLFEDTHGLEVTTNAVNMGFLRSSNAAVQRVDSEFVVLLNSDVVVEPSWLEGLLALAEREPSAALIGCRLISPQGKLQEAGVIMYRDGLGTPHGRGADPERPEFRFVRQVDCVTGACILVRRSAFEAVGRFDDSFAPAFFEEYDLAFALRAAGYQVLYQPATRVVHASAASYGVETRDRLTGINREKFRAKWSTELAGQYQSAGMEFMARERPHQGGVVLVIDDSVPEHDRSAGALTTRQHIELLQEDNMKVVFLPDDAIEREPYGEQLRQRGVEVLAPGVDPEAWLQSNGRFVDRVLVARPLVASRHLPALRRWTTARIVYYTHDLHYQREHRRYLATADGRALSLSRYLHEIETRVLRRVDAVLTPSSAEVPIVQLMAPGQSVAVEPPFIEGGRPAPGTPLAQRDAVMFLGGFNHEPNVDAAQVLVNELMPIVWHALPQTRVLIVGNAPPPAVRELASERVTVTGHVADLDEYFRQARMTISPLRYGSGIKVKVLASLHAGVPVVTTAVGNEGIELRDGIEALLGDTSAALAALVVRLFREPGLAEALAAAGQAAVRDRFSRERARSVLIATMRDSA